MRREHFFFLSFLIGMSAGWFSFDHIVGNWFASQSEGVDAAQLISLSMLKFALVLALGGLATIPYIFCIVDGEKELRRLIGEALLKNYSAFVLVKFQESGSRLPHPLFDHFRPPRFFY